MYGYGNSGIRGTGMARISSKVMLPLIWFVSQLFVCHSRQAKRDPESSNINKSWIPAFAGMTSLCHYGTVCGGGHKVAANQSTS